MSDAMSDRRIRATEEVDQMPTELRECVHEFGIVIVRILMKHGIKKPAHIREIVLEIWRGARQEGQGGDARDGIDFAISRNLVSYDGLVRLLKMSSLAIVSTEPTRAMLDASMSTVSGYNLRITKEEKHRRRLRAALKVAMD